MATGFVEFVSYEKFKDNLVKPQIQYSQKPIEEIEKEMLAVVAAYEGR